MPMEETITITLKEYNRLREREEQLSFLEERGVDNWSGYGTLPDRLDFDTEEEYDAAVKRAYNDY